MRHLTPSDRESLERLTPYVRASLGRAADRAATLHASRVTLEHWVLVLLDDEESAAHQAIVHAFADPATIHDQVLALTPGILVVGSGLSLPFSVRGVHVLQRARAAADRRGDEVHPSDLLSASLHELSDESRAAIQSAGLQVSALDPDEGRVDVPTEAVFKSFDNDAKRTLGAACRVAASLRRDRISPAHIAVACLDVDRSLGSRVGCSSAAARRAMAGSDDDTTPVSSEPLELDPEFNGFLEGLSAAGDSCEVLRRILHRSDGELKLLLAQQRITEELMERIEGRFHDPATPQADL